MKYIVIIVDEKNDTHEDIIIDDVKIEYVGVGEIFHGRHFNGHRPTHFIMRAKSYEWFQYMAKQAVRGGAKWVTKDKEDD